MVWNLSKYSDNIALKDEQGNKLTYQELEQLWDTVFKNIKKRSLVFCMCKNSIGSVAGYVTFVNNGIVPVLLNSNMDSVLLSNLIATYLPKYIWLPTEQSDKYDQYSTNVVCRFSDYSLIETSFDKEYALSEELCLMLTTSGSTGSPKFVRQSYKNVLSNASSIVTYLELNQTEKPITTLPMNYTYGLSIINSHLLVGATILLTEATIIQKEFWAFFKSENATSFGGVPYTYEMLDKLRFYRMNLPSLRYITQAGGKLTVDLHKKFAEYAASSGKKFIVMYGQCEATARMGYLPADKALEKCGSMGKAIPNGKFYLIDGNNNVIESANVTGELIYEGENVTLGYAECGDDLKKPDERHGVLHTGDMAQFDEDGYYYIVGRKKRFLKIYGNRVNLDEIDRMIKGEFNNIECASSGKDDHLFLFVTDESVSSAVKEFVSVKTKLNPIAFTVIVLDEIPKNDSGKVLYRELAKYYE